jgi:hypothetical protein
MSKIDEWTLYFSVSHELFPAPLTLQPWHDHFVTEGEHDRDNVHCQLQINDAGMTDLYYLCTNIYIYIYIYIFLWMPFYEGLIQGSF